MPSKRNTFPGDGSTSRLPPGAVSAWVFVRAAADKSQLTQPIASLGTVATAFPANRAQFASGCGFVVLAKGHVP